MREIKLSGRERAVIRAIDYTSGSTGQEIYDRTQIDPPELADVLHAFCDIGYLEVFPPSAEITPANYAASRFEVNPSYAQEIKLALRRT